MVDGVFVKRVIDMELTITYFTNARLTWSRLLYAIQLDD